MKVKMLQSQAGTGDEKSGSFVRNVGDVIDVPRSEALRMVAGQLAVLVGKEKDEPAEPPAS